MKYASGVNLECPTKQETIRVYTQVFDAQKAQELWKGACDAQKLPYQNLSLEELERVFDHLAGQNGTIGVYGMSLKVKILSYKLVTRKLLPLYERFY